MRIASAAAPPFHKNGYVVWCEIAREAVLIDPGDEVGELLDLIRREKLTTKAILLTHAHLDHVTGVAAAKTALGVEVWLHEADNFLYKGAVQQGVLKSGIMYECVRHNVDFVLAGSIRDDGPLPDVITDALIAQQTMRDGVRDVTFCLMIATMLHSVAVGNLLPAWVKVVCIDINPSTVIKLSDRGSWQTVGLVTDVEPFLRALVQEVEALEKLLK